MLQKNGPLYRYKGPKNGGTTLINCRRPRSAHLSRTKARSSLDSVNAGMRPAFTGWLQGRFRLRGTGAFTVHSLSLLPAGHTNPLQRRQNHLDVLILEQTADFVKGVFSFVSVFYISGTQKRGLSVRTRSAAPELSLRRRSRSFIPYPPDI